MSWWDAMTWATILVLGPGGIVVFVACLADAWRVLREHRSNRDLP